MSAPQQCSTIERQIDVTRISENQKDVFTNSSSFWRPGAHGIYGGFAIAQSLRAAQQTIGEEFSAHSLRGSFIFAGKSDKKVIYHVERIRDGKGFCTRLVRALQGERPIFICIIGFTKEGNSGRDEIYLEHSPPMPSSIPEPGGMNGGTDMLDLPYVNGSVGVAYNSAQRGPEDKKIHQWIKACGPLSTSATQIQQAALAFMSDSYFLVGIPHSREIWNFVSPPISEFYPSTKRSPEPTGDHTPIQRPHLRSATVETGIDHPRVSMMVSLDHTIYFHNLEKLRVDEWLLSEVQSSWAGNGRGLVHQKMWTKDGALVATCIQEVSYSRCQLHSMLT